MRPDADEGHLTDTSTRRIGPWAWPPSLAAVIGGLFALWGLYRGLRPLADNSFLTHLATGRLILESGSVPTSDPYSVTAAGEPWVVQSWLASVLYGVAEAVGGEDGLRLLVSALTVVLSLACWRLTREASSLVVRVGLTALVMGIGAVMWAERPLLFGLVFLAAVLLVLEAPDADPRWLAPVMWLWVNTHGSWPLALVLVATVAAGTWADRGDRPEHELRVLMWVALGTLLGAVNPIGPELLVFPVTLLDKTELLSYVREWQSPDFSSVWARLFLVEVMLGVIGLSRRPSLRRALPSVVFLAAALLGLRNVAVASIVFLPVVASGLAGLGSLDGSRRSAVGAGGFVAIIVAAMAMVVVGVQRPVFDLDGYPVHAVAWLDSSGGPGRADLVTDDVVGNFLIGVHGTEAGVYVDDRYDMYAAELVEDLIDLVTLRPGWRSALVDAGAETVLWRRESPLALVLVESEAWRVTFSDSDWVVFVRR